MSTFYRRSTRASRQAGFSLLEVLISIVVTSIGLLGLAAMQATGLRNNHSAYHNSQATVMAYDMADRIRANTGAIDNYLTSYMAPADATSIEGCLNSGGCSMAEMAENDLASWNTALTTAIPGAIGTIEITGGVYTVSVSWDDNRLPDDGPESDDDDREANFQVDFQP